MVPPAAQGCSRTPALLRKLLTFSRSRLISVVSTPSVTEMHREVSRPRRVGLFIALPLIGVALLATACGGGSTKTSSSASSSTTAPSGSTGSTAAASRAKFTQCLESHGVPASVASAGFGRRGPGGSTSSTTTGGSSSTGGTPAARSGLLTQYQSAFNACRSDLPSGLGRGGNLNSATFAAYRNCLEIHGVTVPTTTPGSTGSGGGFGGGFGGASQSPAFQAAQKACASLLPARPTPTTTASPAAS
jgi:hypothetical protein